MKAKISREAADELICTIKKQMYTNYLNNIVDIEVVKSAINSMVEPEPAPKFPIGTRVQINPEVGKSIPKENEDFQDWAYGMGKYIGMHGEVTCVDTENYTVTFPDGECWHFHESHLLPAPPEPEFEVGDWVKHNNFIFKIKNIIGDGLLDYDKRHYVKKYCQKIPSIQLPGEKPAQGKWAKTKVDKGEHRIGERVLLVQEAQNRNWICYYTTTDGWDYYSENELEML